MSKVKTAAKTKKRAQRATSNVFAMFDQAQIQEFKEAFNMIDQNHDGFIDKEDLHDMLASLGNKLMLCSIADYHYYVICFTFIDFLAYMNIYVYEYMPQSFDSQPARGVNNHEFFLAGLHLTLQPHSIATI